MYEDTPHRIRCSARGGSTATCVLASGCCTVRCDIPDSRPYIGFSIERNRSNIPVQEYRRRGVLFGVSRRF